MTGKTSILQVLAGMALLAGAAQAVPCLRPTVILFSSNSSSFWMKTSASVKSWSAAWYYRVLFSPTVPRLRKVPVLLSRALS